MRWLLGGNTGRLVLAVALSVLSYLFAGGLMFTSGYMISLAATIPLTVLALHLPSLFVRIFGIGKPPIHYAYRLQSHDWVLRMTSRLRLHLYEALRRHAKISHSQQGTGSILSMLTDDIGHAQDIVLRGILPTMLAWIVAVILVVLAGALSPLLGLALLALLILACVVAPMIACSANLSGLSEKKQASDSLYESLADDLLGITEWRISGRRRDFIESNMALFLKRAAIDARLRRTRRICELVAQALFCLCIAAIVLWAALTFGPAFQAVQNPGGQAALGAIPFLEPSRFAEWLGSLTPVNSQIWPANWIAAFALFFFPLMEALSQVEQALEVFGQQRKSVDQLVDFIEGQKMGEDAHKQAQSGIPSSSPDISIRKMSFSYGRGPIFEGMDLQIPYGQKVAITGRSGVGKTTLLALVHGDLAPTEGQVTVDGVKSAELKERIHQTLGFVGQFPYLFDMTLRENLRIAKADATDAELMDALESVGLGEMVRALPRGLDTRVCEHGGRFSGGERQRIALARVLLAKQPIIILDEPFANLDAETTNEVLDTLLEVFSNKTVIAVTHDKGILDRFDRVIDI